MEIGNKSTRTRFTENFVHSRHFGVAMFRGYALQSSGSDTQLDADSRHVKRGVQPPFSLQDSIHTHKHLYFVVVVLLWLLLDFAAARACAAVTGASTIQGIRG